MRLVAGVLSFIWTFAGMRLVFERKDGAIAAFRLHAGRMKNLMFEKQP